MTGVFFHPDAANEMNAAAAWYEKQQKGLGKRYLTSVQGCVQKICINPGLYPEVYPNFRRGLVHNFPFAVVYSIVSDQIEIYAVMHMRRDPEYWKCRLSE